MIFFEVRKSLDIQIHMMVEVNFIIQSLQTSFVIPNPSVVHFLIAKNFLTEVPNNSLMSMIDPYK